jgi:hypothetical protein
MPKLFSILLIASLYFSPVWAQVTSATLLGTVADVTAAVLPGAEITVTRIETGISRTDISDDEGRYRFSNLTLGNYEVVASLPGFQTSVRTGIELTLGRQAVVDFTLQIGEISERVTVTGEASLIETTSSSLGDLVDRQTVLELPLNGRDLTSLLTLGSGASNISTRQSGNASRGYSQKVSISGARPNDVGVLLDGTDTKGLDQSVPSGVSGNFIGSEAVQEFKIEKNSYSAEYGGASGGIINVVTKAGTNNFHGSVYYFHRNDNLDASPFRAPIITDASGAFVGKEKGEFKRNQFGFSIGGPVITNSTFFFFNYEGFRERLSLTDQIRVPTAEARQGIINGVPVAGTDPAILPWFALYPLPGAGATDLGNGITRESIVLGQPTDEDFYQARVDHQFSDSDSIFFRLTWQDSERLTPEEIPQWSINNFVINRFTTFEHKHIFSPSFLNTFRFGFNRRGIGTEGFEDPVSDSSLRFVPLSAWRAPLGAEYVAGAINTSGLDNVGLGRAWADRKTNSFEYIDDINYNRGAHSLKFGFTWKRLQLNGDNPSRPAGEFRFRSLTDFLTNVPRDFRGDVSPLTTSVRGLRMNVVGWYIQDDYQFSPNLTFNLGFRHEFYTVPNEVNGKLANLRDPLNDTTVTYNAQIDTGEAWFNNPSKASIMPRVGIAWDPTGSGRTAIRLGAGLFYNHIQPDTFRRAIFRTQPFALETQVGGSTIRGGCSGQNGSCFPDIFDKIVNEGLGDPDLQPFPFDYMRNPHMWQWNLNVQHEVLPGTAVSASYAGNRGLNIMHQTNLNTGIANVVNGRYVFPAGAQVRNQGFPQLGLLSQETSSDSWYHAAQLGLQRRFQDGFQIQVSYTFSKTIDESSQINSAFSNNGGGVSYYPDPDMRRSLAAFHVANVFSTSGVWQLPFARNLDGLAGGILDGWQVSAVLKLADGPPLSVSTESTDLDDLNLGLETPDLVGSNSPVLGGPDLYFDPTAFAPPPDRTIGNVGRNTLLAPGLANLDFSLTKKTTVGENVTVEFRAEFYNLLNRSNLGLPSTQAVEDPVYNPDGSVASFDIDPDAGFIDDTTTKQREIQFGLRIAF